MNYHPPIRNCDVANGSGLRVSLFVSGCTNQCPGCFNPETWSFTSGEPFDEKAEKEIIGYLSQPYIKGLSLLGGDPMHPANQKELLPFVQKIRELFPEKDIWCWTGYLFDSLKETSELLRYIDVLVDGPFLIDRKDLRCFFRGSTNQRIIDVKASLDADRVVLAEEYYENPIRQ